MTDKNKIFSQFTGSNRFGQMAWMVSTCLDILFPHDSRPDIYHYIFDRYHLPSIFMVKIRTRLPTVIKDFLEIVLTILWRLLLIFLTLLTLLVIIVMVMRLVNSPVTTTVFIAIISFTLKKITQQIINRVQIRETDCVK